MGLSPGTRLDSYAISGPLGSGGMGEVYRARDTRLGREVAVKALAGAGMAARLIWRDAPASPPAQFDLRVPLGMVNSFYLSPDGRKLAFATRPPAGARIWVRSLNSATAEPIPSTLNFTASRK